MKPSCGYITNTLDCVFNLYNIGMRYFTYRRWISVRWWIIVRRICRGSRIIVAITTIGNFMGVKRLISKTFTQIRFCNTPQFLQMLSLAKGWKQQREEHVREINGHGVARSSRNSNARAAWTQIKTHSGKLYSLRSEMEATSWTWQRNTSWTTQSISHAFIQ